MFANKDSKKKNIPPINVDNKHQDILKQFENHKDDLVLLEKEQEQLQSEFDRLSNISNSEISDEDLEKKFKIKCDLEDIEKKISNVLQQNNETQYYVHTGHILFKYYDKVNNTHLVDVGKSNPMSKSIIDFFKKDTPKENIPKQPANQKNNLSKSEMLDKYMSYVDSKFVSDKDKEEDVEVCKRCNVQKLLMHAEGLMVCENCAIQEYILLDCDKPSYKEPPKEISYFAYKRINHFNEHLSQFQGKESTEIPQEIYDSILEEIKKERIKDLSCITQKKVKAILKKKKLNKYYEHVPHIVNHINGLPPPNITKAQEEKLRVLFKEIQIPFVKYCPESRQNFLSYTYVLNKFCELLEWDDLLDCFPLLKSREKLQEQDIIWEKICNDLDWEFYKSL